MPLIQFLQAIQRKIKRKKTPFPQSIKGRIQRKRRPEIPTTISISFHIDRHLDTSFRYPGRNVIIKDMKQLGKSFEKILDPLLCTSSGHQRYALRTQTKVDILPILDEVEVVIIKRKKKHLGIMPLEKMLDPHTGEPLCTLGGNQRYTLHTPTKVDIMCMTDGVEDTSPDALTKAYLVFSAVGIPGSDAGSLCLMVHTMVKAFDENQEILIPTAPERKFILRFDIRKHEYASQRYRGRNFILKDPEQLVSAHWTHILPQDPATGEIQEDAQGNQKMEFRSDTKIDIVPLMDGVEDTSPDALTKAFLVFSGGLTLNPAEGTLIPILDDMVKAFDENQEIRIDTQGLEATLVYPGRNVIIKDPSQLRGGEISSSLDPKTGAQVFSPEGFKKVTVQFASKVDIIPMIDGVEDTSPNALTKAFLLFNGVLVPDPDSGEEGVQIEEMVKAFDEHQEIIIDN